MKAREKRYHDRIRGERELHRRYSNFNPNVDLKRGPVEPLETWIEHDVRAWREQVKLLEDNLEKKFGPEIFLPGPSPRRFDPYLGIPFEK